MNSAAERDLARTEARYRALLSGMLDQVVTIDSRGTIQEVSESVEAVFGYRPEDLVGRNVKMLMAEPHRSAHDGYLAHYRRTGETSILNRTREFEVVRKDGETIVCALSVARVDVPGDAEPAFIGTFRDVTAQRLAEEELRRSEELFRAIFDQEFQFAGLLSPDGILLQVNRAALNAAGVERGAVLGKPFWDTPWWAHSGEERARVRQAVSEAARGQFVRFETTHAARNDGLSYVDFSIKPFRDESGEVRLLLPEGRDVTYLRDAQRRETAMLRALARIGESASLLAHEIKNPITAVNHALRAVALQLGEEQSEVLEDLAKRMKKLEATMRRTLSFARPLDVRAVSVPVSDLFDAALSTLRPDVLADGVSIEVDVPPGCAVRADPALLEDVLVNLIRNALDARAPAVRLSGRAGADGEVVLTVDDAGPGIAESTRQGLFQPFVTTKEQGTGLGLALCRKIVEEHAGSITAEQSALGGACFRIRLPAAEGPRGIDPEETTR